MEPYKINKIAESFEWEDFSLFKIRDMALKDNEFKLDKQRFVEYISSLWRVFHSLGIIVNRIDEDIDKEALYSELFYKSFKVELTEEEKIKEDEYSDYIELIVIDFCCFFVWMIIFLDKLVQFLWYTLDRSIGSRISNASFKRFLSNLNKFSGKELVELYLILNMYLKLYNELDEIRDHFIIHKPEYGFSISKKTPVLKVYFHKKMEGDIKRKEPSNLDIKIYIQKLKNMLKEINEFLCINIENIPFQGKRKDDSRAS